MSYFWGHSKCYLHGVRPTQAGRVIDKLYQIFVDQEIKTKDKLNYERDYGFNGKYYVSVCRKMPVFSHFFASYCSAYYGFVRNHFCFMMRDCMKVVSTSTITVEQYSENIEYYKILKEKYPMERISDMYDEFQVYGSIPFSEVIAFGIPIKHLNDYLESKEDWEKFREVLAMAEALGLDLVDSSAFGYVEKYEWAKKVHKNVNGTKVLKKIAKTYKGD